MSLLGGIGGVLSGIGSIAGAFGGGGTSRKRELDSYRLQSQAMRENIKPLVTAYKDAGIHPLYGMSGQQWSPGGAVVGNEPSVGERLASAGQGIARAAGVYQDYTERAYTKATQTLSLERMKLENDLLRAQTTQVHAATTPALPGSNDSYLIPGQGDSRRLPGYESGSVPDAGFARSRNNTIAVIPSQDVKNRIEDVTIPEVQWYLRQLKARSPDGTIYDPFTSEYYIPKKYSPGYFYTKGRDWLRSR